MTEERAPQTLTGVLDQLLEGAHGGNLSLDELLRAFDGRFHGPLLLVPGLLTVLPTGMLPGVPHLLGILVFLISVQMLVSRKRPWLPRRLGEFSIPKDKLESSVEKVRPWTRRIDKVSRHRLPWLTGGPADYIIALTGMALGLLNVLLGMVPMGAFVSGMAILLLGIGRTTRDGIVIIVAYLFAGGGVWLAYYMSDKILSFFQ